MRKILSTLLALVAFSLPALACATLDSAVPKVGATVDKAPSEIVLHFSMGLDVSHSTLTVTGADGQVVSSGPAYLIGGDRTILATKLRPLAAGKYKVQWSILADCGEQEPGDYKFTVASP